MSNALRARSLGGRLVSGRAFAETGVALATGAAISAGAQMLVEHTDFFNKYWYAPALATGVVGHLLKGVKNDWVSDAGTAAVGAAGAMGYYSYKLNAASRKASGTEASGVQSDVGAPDDYVNALKALPDAAGIQSSSVPFSRSANPLSGMRTAA